MHHTVVSGERVRGRGEFCCLPPAGEGGEGGHVGYGRRRRMGPTLVTLLGER